MHFEFPGEGKVMTMIMVVRDKEDKKKGKEKKR